MHKSVAVTPKSGSKREVLVYIEKASTGSNDLPTVYIFAVGK